MSQRTAKRELYLGRDVDEPVDAWFHRPLAAAVVAVLRRTPISPNQVSVASGLFGIAAGVAIALAAGPSRWLLWVGSACIFVSVILDCCDGQLARLRGESSMTGRALDGLVDAVVVVSIFLGFAIFLVRAGLEPVYVVLVGAAAGYSWRRQAEDFDLAKLVYLANTSGAPRRDTLPALDEIEAERARLRAQGRWGMALVLSSFKTYTALQRRRRRGSAVALDRAPMDTPEQRLLYRGLFVGHMRLWTWNGHGLHLFLMYVSGLVAPFWPPAPLAAWWIMIVPLNILLVIAHIRGFELENALRTAIKQRSSP